MLLLAMQQDTFQWIVLILLAILLLLNLVPCARR